MQAMRKAYHANCWGPLGGNAVGVTSIAELTYRTFADMGRAIAEIGEVGYTGVELFDGNFLDYESNPAELRGILGGGESGSSPHTAGPILSFPTFSPKSLRESGGPPMPRRASAPSISSLAAAPSGLEACVQTCWPMSIEQRLHIKQIQHEVLPRPTMDE